MRIWIISVWFVQEKDKQERSHFLLITKNYQEDKNIKGRVHKGNWSSEVSNVSVQLAQQESRKKKHKPKKYQNIHNSRDILSPISQKYNWINGYFSSGTKQAQKVTAYNTF